MTYDTKTVLARYQQLQDLPEGEAVAGGCCLLDESGPSAASACTLDSCRNCCVGVVEVVRQVHAQHIEIEEQAVTFNDMLTQANEIERGKR